METRQQKLIRKALEHGAGKTSKAEAPRVSLRDQSLRHTSEDYVPRTLTPHEWEQYYAAYGVPQSHRQEPADEPQQGRSRFRLVRWFKALGFSRTGAGAPTPDQ